MKKILSFIMFLSLFAFAEITPEFQAFAPNFMKLDKAVKGYHDFTLKVDVAPWSFTYKGQVKAPNGDPYLLYDGIDAGDVFIVIAYVPAPVQGPEGDEYQAGIFDIMIYYTDGTEELAATIKNASVELLPPLSADQWAKESMAAAKNAGGAGTVWTNSKYAKAITVASADPLDKDKLLAAKKAKKDKQKKALEEKRAREAALAAEEDNKRANKSKMAREQAKRDSIAAVKKAAKKRKIVEEEAVDEDAEEPAPVVKKKRKKVIVEEEATDEDDESLTPKERKKLAIKARKAKMQKAAIAEDEAVDEDAEEPAPVVKKKKKVVEPAVEEDSTDEEAPVVKKKKKKKKKVVVEDEYDDEE